MLAGAALGAGLATMAAAQDDLAKYKAMLADPFANPGLLWVDEGEALWNTPAGPKNATLEGCDLGLGAGVVDGAYVQMPRYFADVDRVMDTETRIAWCRETLQGIPFAETAKKAFSKRGGKSEMEQLVAFVANRSEGQPMAPPLAHAKEKEAYALGEALFYRRAGLLDYSCVTCHGAPDQRIRLQDLPNLLTQEGAASAVTTWPTYRVSQETVRTMQHRMYDCYWQMRLPDVGYGSDVTIALISYLNTTAAGGEMAAPALKR
jgi:sulfur-oxidizing protein SoxA